MIQKPKSIVKLDNFIDGKWQPGTGQQMDVISPYYGEKVGEFHCSTRSDVAAAVQAAKQGFEQWRSTPIKERCQIMFRFRDILLERIAEISHVVSLENGKTPAESKAGLLKGIEVLEFATALQNSDPGGKGQVSRGVHCEYRREPIGVVASITPFNFPAMVPMWTIPIALTLGNSYVWKPSEKTPLTSKYIADALHDAGIPSGVFTVVQGGQETATAVIDHEDVCAVGFVGSSQVAQAVYQQGTNLGKRVLALGGAKNHIILLPDAHEELAGKGISDSYTGCAGQRCMAASVLLAVGDVSTQIDAIVKRSQEQTLGHSMGAIISEKQLHFLHAAIDRAIKGGAKLILDGRQCTPPQDYPNGFWLGPTILDQVDPQSEAGREELFGPILSIIRCQSITEAIAIESQNPYGNACSVFTSNGGLAEKVVTAASAGMVGINIGVPVPREPFSFGGIGKSRYGHGDITGQQGVDFWSQLKKVTTKWDIQSDHNWMS